MNRHTKKKKAENKFRSRMDQQKVLKKKGLTRYFRNLAIQWKKKTQAHTTSETVSCPLEGQNREGGGRRTA